MMKKNDVINYQSLHNIRKWQWRGAPDIYDMLEMDG